MSTEALLLPFVVSKPYTVELLGHTIDIFRIAFLLEGGENIWKEDSAQQQQPQEILEQIDIFCKGEPKNIDGITLLPVDPLKTQLSEFLFYDEQSLPLGCDSETLMWRSFFYFQEGDIKKNFIDSWKYLPSISKYIDEALKVWNDINI